MNKLFKLIGGLFKFLFVIFAVLITVYLFRNPIISYFLEKELSIFHGSMVNIKGFDNHFFSLDIDIDSIAITNNKNLNENIVELNQISFKLDPKPLLNKKIIINEAKVDNLLINQKREKNGKLPKSWEKLKSFVPKEKEIINRVKADIKSEKNKIAILDFNKDNKNEWVEKILKELDIKSANSYNEVNKTIKDKEIYWKTHLEKNNYKDRAEKLSTDGKNITYDYKEIKKVDSLDKALIEAKKIDEERKKAKTLINDIDKLKTDLKTDYDKFRTDYKELKKLSDKSIAALKEDYKKIANIKEGKNSLINVSQLLFGDTIGNYLKSFIVKTDNITSSPVKSNKKVAKITGLPKFWLKSLKINAKYEDKNLIIDIKDICSHPDLINKPIMGTIEAQKIKTIKLDFVIDNRVDKMSKKFKISFYKHNLKGKYLGLDQINQFLIDGSLYLEMKKDHISVNLDSILYNIDFYKPLDFNNDELNKNFMDIINNPEGITLDINYIINDKLSNLTISSNIDDLFNKQLNNYIEKETKIIKDKIKNRSEEKINEINNRLNKEIENLNNKYGISINKDMLKTINSIEDLSKLEKEGKNIAEELIKKEKEKLKEKAKSKIDKKDVKKIEDKLKKIFK